MISVLMGTRTCLYLSSEQQVDDVVQELTEQVVEDAADDQGYHESFDRITLGNMFLFNTLAEVDLEMLFEEISLHPH